MCLQSAETDSVYGSDYIGVVRSSSGGEPALPLMMSLQGT